MEATLGFEPRIKALQAHALPLGYVALLTSQKSGAQSRTWTGTEKNPRDFKSLVSTIPPPGRRQIYLIKNKMERETRVELATSTMARSRSTTELFPHIWNENRILSNTSLNFYNFFKKYQISCYFFYHWKIYIVF